MSDRHDRAESRSETLVWGIVLIGLGVVFLLAMLGQLPWDFMGTWWPLFPMGVGFTRLVTARSPRAVGSGVSTFGIGCWLLIASNDWYGLGWSRSWPLVLVAVGFGSLAQAVAAYFWRKEENGHVC